MSDRIDHVSGNAIPPGAVASEVRDDVPIMASESEFIIPADVVRFLGLDKLEKMISKAKESLAELDAQGRIGGDTGDDEEEDLPFGLEELMSVEEGEAEQGSAPSFAEGGMVEGEGQNPLPMFNQDNGFTGIKTFKTPDGRIATVPYTNGEPLFTLPSGYEEVSPTAPPESQTAPEEGSQRPIGAPKPQETGVMGPRGNTDTERKDQGSPLAGDPSKWSVDNFIDFGKQRGSVANKAIGAMGSLMGPIGMAMKARNSILDQQTAELYDQMLEEGKDLQGNLLTSEQMTQLGQTREQIKEDMSKISGLSLNPFKTLTQAAIKFNDFVVGNKAPTTSSLNETYAPSSSDSRGVPYKSTSTTDAQGNITSQSRPAARPTSLAGGPSGSDNDNPSGESIGGRTQQESSRTHGGLYRKGGLIKRRKKS